MRSLALRHVLSVLLVLAISTLTAALKAERHGKDWQPEYVLVATAQNITIDCHSRYSVVFNGTSPGPPLIMEAGKTTWVRVYNNIENENVTVHWHGLSQATAPFSDGSVLVSQWPIKPGEFFDYEVHPELSDEGTFAYHSHIGFQAGTGYGLLIVNPPEGTQPAYEYDGEFPIVFSDFYPQEDATLVEGLVSNPFRWTGEPHAVLLNGQSGRASFDSDHDDTCKPAIIEVEAGKTYRLRYVGITSLSFVLSAIEGHDRLDIIEADGEYTKSLTTSWMQLASGQRFSVLLRTKTVEELAADGKTQYWIRYETRDRPTELAGYALLKYKVPEDAPRKLIRSTELRADLPAQSPVTLSRNTSEITSWTEYQLEALRGEKMPRRDEVTRTVLITTNQMVHDGFYNGSIIGRLQWEQNGLSWSEEIPALTPSVPYLVSYYQGAAGPDLETAKVHGGWDPAAKAFPAQVGEVIDIIWQSNSGPTGGYDNHPIHMHGYHPYNLGSGNGTYDAAANDARLAGFEPARRDTLQLYRYAERGPANHTMGWRGWRIRVTENNVGAWLMHCHILAHMVMGMQTVWVFGDTQTILREVSHPYTEGYLQYGGSAFGNDSHDPLVVHYFDERASMTAAHAHTHRHEDAGESSQQASARSPRPSDRHQGILDSFTSVDATAP